MGRRANPDRPGRFFHYTNMRPEERAALTEQSNSRIQHRQQQFRGRSVWPERGMKLNEIPSDRVREIAMEKGWTTFVNEPEPYDRELVIEFYAAMIPPAFNEFHSVVVRDRIVRMPAEAICAHYAAPHHAHLADNHGLSQIPGVRNGQHYSSILAVALRRSRKELWVPHDHDIKKAELLPEIALWLKFIKCNLTPSTHDNTVDAYVAKVLFHLQRNLPLDIGYIIRLHMIDAASNTNNSGILPFPCLITRFCREAGCGTDVLIPPPPPFDRHTYNAQVNAANRFDRKAAAEREGRRMRIPEAVDNMDADDDDDEDYNPATDMEGIVLGTDIPGLALQMQGMEIRLTQRIAALEEGRRYGGSSQGQSSSHPDEAGPSTRRRGRH